MSFSRQSCRSSCSTWAWIDTSSAVVGSSATTRLRLGAQRQRDHDALPHAAGELVRVGREARLRRRNADRAHQLERALGRLALADGEVRPDGLDQLLADRAAAD